MLLEDLTPEREQLIDTFIDYCCEYLGIQRPPIDLADGPDFPTDHLTFGIYNTQERTIQVSVNGRHLMDILRTLAHELVHHRQFTFGTTWTSDELESEANTVAAQIMREYAKMFPQLFHFVAEDAVVVNAVGSGAYAGLGGPNGEPAISKSNIMKRKKLNLKTFRQFTKGG